jgi:hypothetical protein
MPIHLHPTTTTYFGTVFHVDVPSTPDTHMLKFLDHISGIVLPKERKAVHAVQAFTASPAQQPDRVGFSDSPA